MRFNRDKFFSEYRKYFSSLSQQQVNGLSRLLKGIENDSHIPAPPVGIYYAAYMLGTVKRETGHTFMPIHEYGGKNYFIRRYGGQTRKGRELGNDTPEEGYFYAGKSDVQVTGESNYEKAEAAMRREYPEVVADFEHRTGKNFDLTVGDQENDTSDPMNILDPAISYAVMSYGMRTGMFTGRKLSQFIQNGRPDYYNMRTIINGHDVAEEIADAARKFEAILRASLITDTTPENVSDVIDAIRTDQPSPVAQPAVSATALPPDTDSSKQKTDTLQNNLPAEQPANKFDSVMGSLETYGGKLERVDGTVSKVSSSSLFSYVSKMLMASAAFGVGFVKDNWEWLVVGAVIVIVGAYLWNESKKRANERTLKGLV